MTDLGNPDIRLGKSVKDSAYPATSVFTVEGLKAAFPELGRIWSTSDRNGFAALKKS
jgi:hypothetical protein